MNYMGWETYSFISGGRCCMEGQLDWSARAGGLRL